MHEMISYLGRGKEVKTKEHTNFYKYNLHSGLEKTN